MGKAALLAISALVIMGAYYSYSTQRGLIDTADRVATHQHEVMARNAALAGFNLAKQELSDSFTGFSQTRDYGSAKYNLNIVVKDGLATITSEGKARDAHGDDVVYTVHAKIRQEALYDILEEAPSYMQYGLMTEEDLTINGNVSFDTLRVEGAEESPYNADIHTNGKLTVKGNAASIRGFGTYVTGVDVKHTKVFKPYSNPAGQPVLEKVSRIDIPYIDPMTIAATVAPDSVTPGDAVISGNYDFSDMGSSREHPYIWHVKGNLKASGNSTFTGYVIFLVEGNIDFSGSVRVGRHEGPGESNYAFYTPGNIDIGGNVRVTGQIMAGGDVKFHGTPQIYGSITVAGQATISGTPNIYYAPASPALTTIFQEPEFRLKLVSYAER